MLPLALVSSSSLDPNLIYSLQLSLFPSSPPPLYASFLRLRSYHRSAPALHIVRPSAPLTLGLDDSLTSQ
eukprot:2081326-Rhodomonas_salina.2